MGSLAALGDERSGGARLGRERLSPAQITTFPETEATARRRLVTCVLVGSTSPPLGTPSVLPTPMPL